MSSPYVRSRPVTGLLAVAWIALLASGPVSAGVPASEAETITWYDVEFIIFQQNNPRSDETWPADTGSPDIDGLQALFGEVDMTSDETSPAVAEDYLPEAYVPLDDEQLQMQGIADSLARSSRYTPLLHAAWTQPGTSLEDARPMRITLPGAFEPEDEQLEDEAASSDNRFEQFPVNERLQSVEGAGRDDDPTDGDMSEENQRPDYKRPLDGSLLVYLKTYLHVQADLLYLPNDINPEIIKNATLATEDYVQQKASERDTRRQEILESLARGELTLEEAEILSLEPEEVLFEGFRLAEKRRLRSREIHYFDHPLYGMILTITPREIEIPPDSDTAR